MKKEIKARIKKVLKKEIGITYTNYILRNSGNNLTTLKNFFRKEFGTIYANYILKIAKV